MKNRFSNNDDDHEDEDMDEEMEHYFDMDDLEGAAFVDAAHVELVNREQDQNILKLSIKLLEKSWFWKFRTLDTKLKLIEKTYNNFLVLLDQTDDEE